MQRGELLAGDADTDDEDETVGQSDGEPEASEEAPAAQQVTVVVDSGEAPLRDCRPCSLERDTECLGPVRPPDDAINEGNLDRLQVATQKQKIHLLIDTQSQKNNLTGESLGIIN